MSDRYSGKQPWLRHYSDQNVVTQTPPFAFNNYSDHSAIINHCGEHLLLHRLQHINYFIPKSPPTTNLHVEMCGRGGAKAYYRFHGGIGDGRGSIGCRATDDNVAARPLQLFEALDPIDFQIDMIKKAAGEDGYVKNPVTGITETEASAGTGVFLPVYRRNPTTRWRWIPTNKVLNNNGGKYAGGGRFGGDRGCVGGGRTGGDGGNEKKQEDNLD